MLIVCARYFVCMSVCVRQCVTRKICYEQLSPKLPVNQ